MSKVGRKWSYGTLLLYWIRSVATQPAQSGDSWTLSSSDDHLELFDCRAWALPTQLDGPIYKPFRFHMYQDLPPELLAHVVRKGEERDYWRSRSECVAFLASLGGSIKMRHAKYHPVYRRATLDETTAPASMSHLRNFLGRRLFR